MSCYYMSLRILAFNTSTKMCSVALMIDDIINEFCVLTAYQHEKKILLMVDQILSKAGITLQLLDFLVFCRGPGSFVGVRIGVSLAQGLALGANLPLVEVSSLKVLAQGIWRLIKARKVLTIINARMGEFYCACYCRQNNGVWLGEDTESIFTAKEISMLISQLHGEWVLVGTGWEHHPMLLSDNLFQFTVRKVLFPSAQDMLPIAVEAWKKCNFLNVSQIKPVYLSQITWNNLSSKINYNK